MKNIKTGFFVIAFGLLASSVSVPALAAGAVAEADAHDFSAFRARAQYLLSKHDCDVCHQVDKASIGPSFREIADRYRDKQKYAYHGYVPKYIWSMEMPMVAGLVKKVSLGGDGEWGGPGTPMPQLDASGANKDEITEIVKAILELPSLPEEEEESGAEVEASAGNTDAELRRLRAELDLLKRQMDKSADAASPQVKVWGSGSNTR